MPIFLPKCSSLDLLVRSNIAERRLERHRRSRETQRLSKENEIVNHENSMKNSGNYPYGQKTQKTTKKFKIHRYIRPCQSSALRKYTPFLAPFHHRHTSRVPISVPNSRQRQLKAKSSHPKEHIYCHAVMESCLEALTGPSRPECGGCPRWIRRGSSARRQAGGRSDRRLGHRWSGEEPSKGRG